MTDESGFNVPSIADIGARIAAKMDEIENDEELRTSLEEGAPSGNPITLGPRLPDADTWAEEQIAGAEAKSAKWLQNTTHPRKNFKEEALRPEAQARYKDSMRKVIEEDRHAGGMKLVNESEAMAIIEARGASAYSDGVRDRKAKITRRVKELHPMRLALCAEIDGMDTSTDAAREKKMITNKRGLQAIGKARRGG